MYLIRLCDTMRTSKQLHTPPLYLTSDMGFHWFLPRFNSSSYSEAPQKNGTIANNFEQLTYAWLLFFHYYSVHGIGCWFFLSSAERAGENFGGIVSCRGANLKLAGSDLFFVRGVGLAWRLLAGLQLGGWPPPPSGVRTFFTKQTTGRGRGGICSGRGGERGQQGVQIAREGWRAQPHINTLQGVRSSRFGSWFWGGKLPKLWGGQTWPPPPYRWGVGQHWLLPDSLSKPTLIVTPWGSWPITDPRGANRQSLTNGKGHFSPFLRPLNFLVKSPTTEENLKTSQSLLRAGSVVIFPYKNHKKGLKKILQKKPKKSIKNVGLRRRPVFPFVLPAKYWAFICASMEGSWAFASWAQHSPTLRGIKSVTLVNLQFSRRSHLNEFRN